MSKKLKIFYFRIIIFIVFFIFLIIGGFFIYQKTFSQPSDHSQGESQAIQILFQELKKDMVVSASLIRLPSQVLFHESRDAPRKKKTVLIPKTKGPSAFVPISEIKESDSSKAAGQEVIKKVYLSPGRDYEEGVFFIGDKKIARQKSVNGQVVEQSGEIPDGEVKIIDELRKNYGREIYKDGKIDGFSRIYDKDNQLKLEAYYENGRIQTLKEFYTTGELRLTANYRDAPSRIEADKEVGIGKVFYRNGQVKFEWNITRRATKGYKKSYDRDGKLTLEQYFDQSGKLLGTKTK